MPVNALTGARADVTAPGTWSDFKTALQYATAHALPGVGFVFTAEDPYAGVDLDDCRDPNTGVTEPWALKIVRELDSYAEISPSGCGVHIIVRGKLPGDRRRKDKIEMYDSKRFFAVTGCILD